MVIHPEIQERAFAEISAAIPDGDRLPSFEDRAKLPYIDCIVQECLRWNPVGNVALAHYLTEDDEYREWRVPKGTTVLANIWAMLHEPSVRQFYEINPALAYAYFSAIPTRRLSIPTGSVTRNGLKASTHSLTLPMGLAAGQRTRVFHRSHIDSVFQGLPRPLPSHGHHLDCRGFRYRGL